MRVSLTLTAVIVMLFCTGSADIPLAEPSSNPVTESAPFADLDGDGINDNLTDSDRDGIPDEPEPIVPTTGIFSGNTKFSPPSLSLALRNSESFNQRLSRITCLTMNRGGFGASENFGPGNGIGAGALSSGACVGGVCH